MQKEFEKFWEESARAKNREWIKGCESILRSLCDNPHSLEDVENHFMWWEWEELEFFVVRKLPGIKSLIVNTEYPNELAFELLKNEFTFIFRNGIFDNDQINYLFQNLMICNGMYHLECRWTESSNNNIKIENFWEKQNQNKYLNRVNQLKVLILKMIDPLRSKDNTELDSWDIDEMKAFCSYRIPEVKMNIALSDFPENIAIDDLKDEFSYIFRYSSIPIDLINFFFTLLLSLYDFAGYKDHNLEVLFKGFKKSK